MPNGNPKIFSYEPGSEDRKSLVKFDKLSNSQNPGTGQKQQKATKFNSCAILKRLWFPNKILIALNVENPLHLVNTPETARVLQKDRHGFDEYLRKIDNLKVVLANFLIDCLWILNDFGCNGFDWNKKQVNSLPD